MNDLDRTNAIKAKAAWEAKTCESELSDVVKWAQDHGEKLVDIAYRACFQPPLDTYDAGLLNDFGGGDVHWWQDYIRTELARAHEFYQSQIGEI
jgi:hypothetical protein